MAESKIEWTEHVWNPVRGCSIISPGCKNCYAMRDAARKNSNPKVPSYKGFAIFNDRHEPHWTGKVELIPEQLEIPLRRRKPTRYFVNSMSDLFHESLPDEAIDRVFAVMALCPQHTFQVLTKRAERMQDYFDIPGYRQEMIGIEAEKRSGLSRWQDAGCGASSMRATWILPFSNVWLGVSCENQQYANERIPLLLQTPAAVRFVSAEPLLGAIDLGGAVGCGYYCDERVGHVDHAFWTRGIKSPIDWVIVGGESGPDARPMHPDWARSIRDQCVAAKVPFFFKQWGEWAPKSHGHRVKNNTRDWGTHDGKELFPTAMPWNGHDDDGSGEAVLIRVGKVNAGRLLDGRTWDKMPGHSVAANSTVVERESVILKHSGDAQQKRAVSAKERQENPTE